MADTGVETTLTVRIEAELSRLQENLDKAGYFVDSFSNDMDKATKRSVAFAQKLNSSFDPAGKAAQRLAMDSAKLTKALHAGGPAAEVAAKALARLNAQYAATVGNAGKAGAAVEHGTRRLSAGVSRQRSFALATQNSAYQIGDFAVQVAAGTDATRALAMQLPQLLGGFGVWGAVAGAVAAIGGALIPVFMDINGESKKAKEELDKYTAALKAVTDEEEKLIVAHRKLAHAFQGDLADPIQRQVDSIKASIAVLREAYAEEFRKLQEGAASAGGVLPESGLKRYVENMLKGTSEGVKLTEDLADAELKLANALKVQALAAEGAIITTSKELDQQRELLAAYNGGWMTYEQLIDRKAALARAAELGVDVVDKETGGFTAQFQEIQKNVQAARELEAAFKGLNKAEKSATDLLEKFKETLASTRSSMEAEVEVLKLRVAGRAEEADWLVKELGLREQLGPLYSSNAEGLRDLWEAQRGLNEEMKARGGIDTQFEAMRQSSKGAVQALNDWRDQALAGLDATATGYEEFVRKVEEIYAQRLPDARRKDLESSREWSAGVKRALADYADAATNAAMQAANVTADAMKSMEDALVGFATGSKSAKDAFRDLATSVIEDLIRMQIQSSVTGPLSRMLGGLFSGIGAGVGASGVDYSSAGTTGAFGPSFAGGGYTGDGPRSGGLDGQGGFMAMVHPRETVTDHTISAPVQRQSLSHSSMVYLTDARVINVQGGSGDVRAQVRAALAEDMPRWQKQAVEQSKAAVRQESRRNPSYLGV